MAYTTVVLGPQEVATALLSTGQVNVLHASSTAGFAKLVRGDLRTIPKDDQVFLVADNLALDAPGVTLDMLLSKMAKGHHTIVLAFTPQAEELVERFPAAGLLRGPFEPNLLLAAVAGKTGWALTPPAPAAVDPEPGFTFPTPSFDAPAAPFDMPPAPDTFGPVADPAPSFGPVETPPAPSFGPVADPAPSFGPVDAPPAPAFAAAPSFGPSTQSVDGFGPAPDTSGFGAPTTFGPPPGAGFGPSQYLPEDQNTHQGLVIAIAAPKGGVGKTTLAVNLAAYAAVKLAPMGKRVALIDANRQQADVSKILNIFQPTIVDLARDPAYQTPGNINSHIAHLDQINLDVVLGPSRPEESNPAWINEDLYNRITDSLRQNHDLIFIDCPVAEPHHRLFQEYILQQSDFLVMPVNPAQHTLANARAWLGWLSKDPHSGVAYDPDRVGVVLNQAQDGVDVDRATVLNSLPNWRFLAEIRASKEWIRASNNNELIGVQNYQEVNEAFSSILYQCTGYDVFTPDLSSLPATQRKGLLSRLFGGRKR